MGNIISRNIKVSNTNDKPIFIDDTNNFNPPLGTDAVTVEYPTTTSEIYRYRTGGIGGTILASVTVNYLLADKNDISSVIVT